MIYKLLLLFIFCDSFFPILSLLKGFYYGKYVIENNLNRMYILNKYLKKNILGSKIKIFLFNKGLFLCFFLSVPNIFILTSYKRNDDYNIYYLTNIQKYYNYNQSLYHWCKLGFNIGQLYYYNK